MKPAPKFWWDFDGPDFDVIVQSDYSGGEELARFKAPINSVGREIEIMSGTAKDVKFICVEKSK